MRYVIIRDDDTNAMTPPEVLDRLYRPFLEQGMVVHLAVIPEVRTDVRSTNGQLEGFLVGESAGKAGSLPIADNTPLLRYLHSEPTYNIVQHGFRHEFVNGMYEFGGNDSVDIGSRLDSGRQRLLDAGFPSPQTFVAPYDQISSTAFREIIRRYKVISTGWYSLRKLSLTFWPSYFCAKRWRKQPHWRKGQNVFFSHPGCLLSHRRDVHGMLNRVLGEIQKQDITVIVTHHWEYFVGGCEYSKFIAILHALAEHLKENRNIRVLSFEEAASLM